MSKCIYATWDHLANVSAASKHLMELKKRVHQEMDTSYQGQSHSTPDTSSLVWRIVHDLKKTGIQTFKDKRSRNSSAVPTIDLYLKGHNQLLLSSLRTFNKNIEVMQSGGSFEEVVDELELPSFDMDNINGEN